MNESLIYLITYLTQYLNDLENVDATTEQEFNYGEKTAFVECLEMIQLWKKAKINGLNYNIEQRFPL